MANYSEGHICQCLRHLATARRNAVITITGDRQKTGEQFVHDVLSLACGLLELGLDAGDVVAISAFNSDLYLEWILAIAVVGGIAAPLNYRWSFEEARSAMLLVQPVMLVTDESCRSWYSNLQNSHIPSLRWHFSLNSPSSDFIKTWNVLTTDMLKKQSAKSLSLNYRWAREGAVMICFTSGTSGRPKGVTLTHAALIVQSLAKIAIVGFGETDVYLHTAPLCHIGGISSAMAMLMVGGCHVIMPKFESKSALVAIEQYRVTSLITVPAIMADIISLIRQKETWKGKETVNKILNGGGGLSSELIKDAALFFPRAKLLTAYGMTETCSSMTFMTLYDPRMETSSQHLKTVSDKKNPSVHQTLGVCVGKPAPHVELKTYTDGSSHVGSILTRGPHAMLGYWGQIPAKASDSSNESWLDTGDVGSIDEYGNLWLVGRLNGKIKSGGENIYPEEVEAILSKHPGIIGIVIVGIPDARLTEMAIACIQLRENWLWSDKQSAKNEELLLSSEILRHYCREKNITGFKIPKAFILWEKPFPVTTTGKVKRDQVRREVMSHLQPLQCSL